MAAVGSPCRVALHERQCSCLTGQTSHTGLTGGQTSHTGLTGQTSHTGLTAQTSHTGLTGAQTSHTRLTGQTSHTGLTAQTSHTGLTWPVGLTHTALGTQVLHCPRVVHSLIRSCREGGASVAVQPAVL